MKKTIAILAASAAGFSGLNAQGDLSITTTVEWQSSYVFRGIQLADHTFMSSLDLEVDGFYAGIWAAMPVSHEFDNEVDFYAGYGWALTDVLTADAGFTYYTYPDAQDKFFDSNVNTFEVYAGVAFEGPFSPAFYVFRDFDLKSWTLELSGGESWVVAEDTTFDLGAHLGYSRFGRGGEHSPVGSWVASEGPDEWVEDRSYWYFGTSVGFTYAFNDYVSAGVSASWTWASEDFQWGDVGGTRSNRFFYGVAVTAGF